MAEGLTKLGARAPRGTKQLEQARKLLRGFFAPILEPGPRSIDLRAGFETRELLRDKRALASLRLPGKFLFLFRLRFGLYAVLARIGGVADWSALESGWARDALASLAPGPGPG